MARSPAEEEDGDASAGSGSWRVRPAFSVGDKVEVRLDGDGFRGAHYVATIAAHRPCCGRYQVIYATLVTQDRRTPLREDVASTQVRPPQPPLLSRRPRPEPMFKLFDLVEAYHDEGWWPGVVSAVRRGSKPQYTVTFPLFREEVELKTSLVRRRREFVCGTWMDAQEVVSTIGERIHFSQHCLGLTSFDLARSCRNFKNCFRIPLRGSTAGEAPVQDLAGNNLIL